MTRTSMLAVLTLTTVISAGAVQATQWDMSYAWPDSNFHVQNGMRFAEEVFAATDGRVEIIIHSGGALGLRGPEAMAAVRDGIVPIAEYSFEQQTGEVPFSGLGAMPGLAMGYAETAILSEVMRPHMDEIFAAYNQKLLYMVPWPGQGVYTKDPIETLADLRGYRVRAANESAREFFETLGAAPVLMPWGEVVPALASGVIDGVSTSSSSGVDGSFWDFMGYFSRFDWANPISVVTVNLDYWNALSAEDQQSIEEISVRLEPEFWEVSKAEDNRNLAILTERGMTVTAPDDSMRAEIVAASEAIWESFLAIAGPEAAEVISIVRERTGK